MIETALSNTALPLMLLVVSVTAIAASLLLRPLAGRLDNVQAASMVSLLLPVQEFARQGQSPNSPWLMLAAVPLVAFIVAGAKLHVKGTLCGIWVVVLWNHVDRALLPGGSISPEAALHSLGALAVVTLLAMGFHAAPPSAFGLRPVRLRRAHVAIAALLTGR